MNKENQAISGVILVFLVAILGFVGFIYFGNQSTKNECMQIRNNRKEKWGIITHSVPGHKISKNESIYYKFTVNNKTYEGDFNRKDSYGNKSDFNEKDTLSIYYSSKNPSNNMYWKEFENFCK